MPASIARTKSLEILLKVDTQGSYTTSLLSEVSKDSNLDPRDQGLIHHIVKGTLQNRSGIDALLDPIVKGGIASLKAPIQNILRLTAYQILYLDRVPKEAAVFEAVELAKDYGSEGIAKLVNGVLRNLIREDPKVSEFRDLATRYSHPKWLVDRFVSQIGEMETESFLAYNNEKWPLTLRTNTVLTTPEELHKILATEEVEVTTGDYDPLSFVVTALPKKKKLHELSSYSDGLFQIQDESASLVPYLVAPKFDELVLDLCAAPGGKTVNLACLMKNSGEIIAADPSEKRLAIVKENCARQKITNVKFLVTDGLTIKADRPFDRILVDAPCSGFGVLGRRSDARWNKDPEEPARLHELQCALLSHAATLVRIGGTIVYSTCTLDLLENEESTSGFIKSHSNFRLVSAPDTVPRELITPDGYLKSWPHKHHIGGAFGAIFERMS